MAKFLALAWRPPVLDIGLANMPMAIDMAIPFIMERPGRLENFRTFYDFIGDSNLGSNP